MRTTSSMKYMNNSLNSILKTTSRSGLVSLLAIAGLSACEPQGIEPVSDVGTVYGAMEVDAPEFRYHSFTEVGQYLSQVANTYPDLAQLGSYGESPAGRPLYVLALGDGADFEDDPSKPNVLLNYSIHGDELITVESALHFVHDALTGYGIDQRTTAILDNVEIFLVPVVSPDGFANQSRTVQGVDPNRQFPHAGDPNRVGISIIESAKFLFDFFQPRGVLDFHAFGELIMLPYGGTFSRPAGFDTLQAIGDHLGQPTGYQVGQISHLFNQTAQGGSNDYYFDQGAFAIGVELGQSKTPSTVRMPGVIADASEIAFRYLALFAQ